ncbi:Hypothetical predicted protein, partial [Olea europaea subsp. europaea]
DATKVTMVQCTVLDFLPETGPLTHNEQDTSSNGPTQNAKDAADEVAQQIDNFHIAEEKNERGEKAIDAE